MKISVQGEQCFPIVKLMAEHLKAAGHDAHADPDMFPRGEDMLWYVGCFGGVAHALDGVRKQYPKAKTVLQWAGSDILWSSAPPRFDFYVAPCANWAREASENFGVAVHNISLTPLKVLPLTAPPHAARILIYGHWDVNGGEKYQVPWILANIPSEVYSKAEIRVVGDGWRATRVGRVYFHPFIHDQDEKERFFTSMSALIYMPKPHEMHRYGGFVSLTPIEFAQMGRQVIRNGGYPYMIDAGQHFPVAALKLLEPTFTAEDETASIYYAREYAPEKCQTRLKEVLSKLASL